MKGTAIIAGAGIGGLTLAHALARAGIEALVVERAPSLDAVGAGITVQSNAMTALRRIGLADAVAAEGQEIVEGAFRTPSGRVLRNAGIDAAREIGEPIIAIHRARLHRVLLSAVGEDKVRLGRKVTGYREDAEGVTATLEGGEEIRCALLVGADGLHSAVRKTLLGDEEPRYSGYTSWRGVCPEPSGFDAHLAGETAGRGERFGVVPIGHGQVYWFAVANAPPGGHDAPDPRPRLRARFGRWHAPIPALIDATPPDAILRTDIRDRPPVSRWSSRRVTLLGDAAHPMTPNLGQGGCQAIEDAVVLAECLSRNGELPGALAAYEARRMARANGMVTRAYELGRMMQWQNPLLCAVRDVGLRMTPIATMQRTLRELLTFPE
ncbi:FAD-dependent monooxygenase [Polyangium aurulentum]|uniref:FAD-dependent monooxygenase n=1 Tax=Polyangium aurulentum TaxID=2567896 RepID=UPI0010ADF866|nr:FAD-dependent monooxygenase [Polyangium aurulentum]UQA59556.1 FAD-dependent monooxygenase [Polyangium aurulentum]